MRLNLSFILLLVKLKFQEFGTDLLCTCFDVYLVLSAHLFLHWADRAGGPSLPSVSCTWPSSPSGPQAETIVLSGCSRDGGWISWQEERRQGAASA